MSIKTWKKEFYPTSADRVSKKKAVAHSLRKWEGLTKTNLKKHGVEVNRTHVRELDDEDFFNGSIEIGAESCALCVKYLDCSWNPENGCGESECATCPLYEYLGHRCDESDMPYNVWYYTQNPRKMISALKKIL